HLTNNLDNTVSVISTPSNTVIATIPIGNRPQLIAITPDGSRAYAANYADNDVSVINTATNTVTTTVAVGAGPIGVAISPLGVLTPAQALQLVINQINSFKSTQVLNNGQANSLVTKLNRAIIRLTSNTPHTTSACNQLNA